MNDTLTRRGVPSTTRERVRYFPRQLVTAADMVAEQEYLQEKLRRHNRYLHGWGVVCGCQVKANPTAERPWQVQVCPGYLVTPDGDEIEIPEPVDFDLRSQWYQAVGPCAQPPPCSPPAGAANKVYLAVCYAECHTRPVRVQPAGCGCDETACEYSRIRDSFELVRLTELPESHQAAAAAQRRWLEQITPWLAGRADGPIPVPDCLKWPDDPCVVIATIQLPTESTQALADPDIFFDDRPVCWSSAALLAALVREKIGI